MQAFSSVDSHVAGYEILSKFPGLEERRQLRRGPIVSLPFVLFRFVTLCFVSFIIRVRAPCVPLLFLSFVSLSRKDFVAHQARGLVEPRHAGGDEDLRFQFQRQDGATFLQRLLARERDAGVSR